MSTAPLFARYWGAIFIPRYRYEYFCFGKLINKHLRVKLCYLLGNCGQCDSANPHVVLALHKLWTIDDSEVDGFGRKNIP